MTIETFVTSYNEEKLIPYVMRYYGQFSKVTFYDNESTDDTAKIAKQLGAEVISYSWRKEFDDLDLLWIKDNCWKRSNADWVILVDADEFVYHKNIVDVLKKSKATIIHPTYHNMFSESFPVIEGQIFDEINMGTPDGGIWIAKMNIFRPKEIKQMNYHVGCHFADPEGTIIIDENSGIKTLHMRFLDREYTYNQYQNNRKKRSQLDKNNGWSVQFDWSKEEINEYFDEQKPKLIKLI
jgi:glycosyltransferase involved in cell wall biosynthesis